MKQSRNDLFITTNQDYGSFYFDPIDPDKIAFELAINDQVRNERRQLPSIAYDIMFDKNDSLNIVNHHKEKYKPIISRRQLKYIKSDSKTNEERKKVIKKALETYTMFIKCIYKSKSEKNPELSNSVLELVANELFLLQPEISSDQLAENLIAITVPHEYLDIPSINPDQPYPGTEADCIKTPCLQHILEHFEIANKAVAESKQRFDLKEINSQPMEGVRYIYNPFTNAKRTR